MVNNKIHIFKKKIRFLQIEWGQSFRGDQGNSEIDIMGHKKLLFK